MMHRLQAVALMSGALLATTLSAWGQQQPLDRTNPRAVAEAYVQACREGNVELAVSLLVPDEAAREVAREFADEFDGKGAPGGMGLTMDDVFMEFQFVPVALNMERQFAEAVEEGAQTRVTFGSAFAFDQNLILVRQEDGTWAIDFFASIRATTGREKSFFEEEMGPRGERAEAMAPAEMQAQMQATLEHPPVAMGETDALRRLHGCLLEYARDHEGRFPPTAQWVDQVELYALDRALFRNSDAPGGEAGYAMNADLDGKRVDELWVGEAEAQDVLLLIEWPTAERNAAVRVDELPDLRSVRPDKAIRYITCLGDQGVLREGMTWEEARPPGAAVEMAPEDGELDREAWENYSVCQRNLQTLTLAARRYATQHGGLLPPADTWQDEIALVLLELETEMPSLAGDDPGGIVRCPAAPDLDFAYAINTEVAGKNALDLSRQGEIILFFECDLNVPNASGTPEQDTAPPRHRLPGRDAPIGLVSHLDGTMGESPGPEPATAAEP